MVGFTASALKSPHILYNVIIRNWQWAHLSNNLASTMCMLMFVSRASHPSSRCQTFILNPGWSTMNHASCGYPADNKHIV